MSKDYFKRVSGQTPTRLWINNPIPEEACKAIDAGAISCTTNPTFCMKMLTNESEYEGVIGIIDSIIKEEESDKKAADSVQQKLVKKILAQLSICNQNLRLKRAF
ncbi:MAG: hypothetical protein ACYDIA_18950 [Candidatus Humimicrobiaceae bacterium]